MPEIVRSLYGHPDGWWAIVEKPQGIVVPPTIRCHWPGYGPLDLAHQGAADDERGRATLAELRRRLAALTGEDTADA